MTGEMWTSDQIVSGLHIRMKSAELAAHLKARADYHRQRHEEKSAVLPEMKAANEKIKAHNPATTVHQFSKSGGTNYRFDGDDAIESLENDIKDHNNKAVAFDFLAAHLFAGDYALSRTDLIQLEILK